ncbi:MAG: biopolymer transporter ExbD [Planctomycetaceae bacterium]|jgi:biopolymer transport protein ExbD|nr:biopolymer transporter ExbD [Planctomycetaceae bacterium]
MKLLLPDDMRPPQMPGLNMTSMIDVVFLLLVFFVCTADFAEPEENLPADASQAAQPLLSGTDTAETTAELDTVHVEITYQDVPLWKVEGGEYRTLQEVQDILRRLKDVQADIPVIIEPAANVPMEHVINLYDVCRRIGLINIKFMAEKRLH